MQRQRGFAAFDLLVAVVIFGTAVFAGGLIAQRTMSAATTVETQRTQYALGSSEVDKMIADAPTARSVFVPPNDVLGNSNADGHEVDFETKVTRSSGQQVSFWAYRFDSASNSLQRYSYAAPGQAATAIGNPVALGSGSSLVATSQSVSALGDALFSGITRNAVQIPSGYSSGGQTIYEGNGVVHVTLATAQGTYDADLVAGASPSGFTVVASTYTPTPAPTSTPTPAPTVAPLSTWPVAVQYGVNGNTLASASFAPPVNVATVLNALLGGSVAQAAGAACPAKAYKDTGFTQLDANNTTYKASLGVYTDGFGCLFSASGAGGFVAAIEPGFAGQFTPNSGSCQSYLVFNTPVTPGVYPTTAGNIATPGCNYQISDGSAQTATSGHGLVAAQVVNCVLGVQCWLAVRSDKYSQIYIKAQSEWSATDTVTEGAYTSVDGGLSWTAQPAYSCSGTMTDTGPTPPSAAVRQDAAAKCIQAALPSGVSYVFSRQKEVNAPVSTTWSPTAPPGQTGIAASP